MLNTITRSTSTSSYGLGLILLLITTWLPQTIALTCSQAILLSGYPSCINSCAAICDKYCGDPLKDPKCSCLSSAYLKDIGACLEKACESADLKIIVDASITGCRAEGIDITTELGSSPSSIATAQSVGATSAPGSSGAKSKQNGFPVSTIVGIVVGVVVGILIGGTAIYLCFRKRKATIPAKDSNETDSAAQMTAGAQTTVISNQPYAKIYPTSMGPQQPTPYPQVQQFNPYIPIPTQQEPGYVIIKQPETSVYAVSELPHHTPHFQAELPGE